MGNSASSGEDDDYYDDEFAKFDGIDTLGYRVLGVQPNSPASQAGLVSFFDFLVGANGKILLASGEDLGEGEEYDDVDFPALCQEFLHKPLELLVWNIKCQEKRFVTITPSDSWGGAGLLGVTIRLDDYGGAEDRLIRVLQVEPNSPAAICGLVSQHDYLLGTTAESFDSSSTLAKVLQQHVDKVVEVYVFNTESDVVRVVALMPTWSWGGNGLLGAEVGTGYLHRLPSDSRTTTGSSVERKVRWVGMKPKHPMEKGQEGQSAMTTLEVEPQLEMEVVDSNAPHEETHKTVQQVTAAPVTKEKQHQPPTVTRDKKQTIVATATENALNQIEHDKHIYEMPEAKELGVSASQQEQNKQTAQRQEPSVQEPTTPQQVAQDTEEDAPADAASFFAAGPPPAKASSAYSSQFLPPPPIREVDLR